jgi:hypothetical protein
MGAAIRQLPSRIAIADPSQTTFDASSLETTARSLSRLDALASCAHLDPQTSFTDPISISPPLPLVSLYLLSLRQHAVFLVVDRGGERFGSRPDIVMHYLQLSKVRSTPPCGAGEFF